MHAPSEMLTADPAEVRTLMTDERSSACRKWIDSTPLLEAWLGSGRALVAPAAWPKDVERAFSPLEVPSPWEFANAIPPAPSHPSYRKDGIRLLAAYACGLSVVDLAAILGVTTTHIMKMMVDGVGALKLVPGFVLWTSNVDFAKSAMALVLPRGLVYRIEAQRKLSENPLTCDDDDASFLAASPLFMSAVKSGAAVKRPGYRPMREPQLVAPPRAEVTDAA